MASGSTPRARIGKNDRVARAGGIYLTAKLEEDNSVVVSAGSEGLSGSRVSKVKGSEIVKHGVVTN